MVAVLSRKRTLILCLILLCFFPPVQISAAEVSNPTEAILDNAPEEVSEAMEQGFTFGSVITNIGELFLGELKAITSRIPMMLIILIFYGIKNCMEFSHSLNRTVSLGCFSATALLTGEIFTELSLVAEDMLNHLSEFVYLTIPALTGLIANGGRVLSAAKSTYFILGFMNVLVFAIQKFFFPMILLYFVFAVISSLLEQDYFSAVKSVLSSLIKTVLPLLVGIFTTVLTLVTSVSKASDELTVKTAKIALGNCIPFLGTVLTDSGEYLIQTVSQIKAQAGLAGILVLCYIFLVPILKMIAGLLVFKLLSVLACLLNDRKSTDFYENVSTALGMLAGIMGTVSVMAVLGIMILMGL